MRKYLAKRGMTDKEYSRKYYAEHKEQIISAINKYRTQQKGKDCVKRAMRKYAQKHKKLGLCLYCPKKLAENSSCRCEYHLAKMNEYGKNFRERKNAN